MASKTLRDERLGGIGLRLVRRPDGTLAGRYSRADDESAIIVQEPDETQDELWQRLKAAALRGDPSFFGFDGAVSRFRTIFPEGFRDAAYLQQERKYKVDARELLNSTVPVQEALTATGFAASVVNAYRTTNIVHPVWEVPRMVEALRSKDRDNLIQRLAAFALGDRSQLSAIARVARKYDAAKWPLITYLPFLWDTPVPHVILRHEPTTRFASSVGHEFPHVYEARLVPAVYESLLDLLARTEHEISELEPRDTIDIQSFIWVVSKYRD
ncbi:MAG: hypothetical protein F4Y02_10745 [Chloroflexi bacterium]|nr:hypothetical protein [Chloroflexota bacterium]